MGSTEEARGEVESCGFKGCPNDGTVLQFFWFTGIPIQCSSAWTASGWWCEVMICPSHDAEVKANDLHRVEDLFREREEKSEPAVDKTAADD